jgi:hypothetical protein
MQDAKGEGSGKVLGRPKVDGRIEAAIRQSLQKGSGTTAVPQIAADSVHSRRRHAYRRMAASLGKRATHSIKRTHWQGHG